MRQHSLDALLAQAFEVARMFECYTAQRERSAALHRIWLQAKRTGRLCAAWQSFNAFQNWATSTSYFVGDVLARRDGAKDYSPENCQWEIAFSGGQH